jgi:hypothetical protein
VSGALITGVWLTLCMTVCGQTLKPLVQVKLEAPDSVDFAVVCDGGESMVGVTEKHDVYVWSLPSGRRRTINVTGGFGGHVNWRKVACNPKVLAMGLSSGAVVVFDPAGTERAQTSVLRGLIHSFHGCKGAPPSITRAWQRGEDNGRSVHGHHRL